MALTLCLFNNKHSVCLFPRPNQNHTPLTHPLHMAFLPTTSLRRGFTNATIPTALVSSTLRELEVIAVPSQPSHPPRSPKTRVTHTSCQSIGKGRHIERIPQAKVKVTPLQSKTTVRVTPRDPTPQPASYLSRPRHPLQASRGLLRSPRPRPTAALRAAKTPSSEDHLRLPHPPNLCCHDSC